MKRMKLAGLLTGLLLACVSYSAASQKIISFSSSVKSADRARGIESVGGKVTKEFRLINAVVAIFPDAVKDSAIYTLSGVTVVEEDKTIKWIEEAPASMTENPLPTMEKALMTIRQGLGQQAPAAQEAKAGNDSAADDELPWGITRVNAPNAWRFTDGMGVKVAIIDTGVDFTHPDLSPNYVGGYNTISPELPPMDDHGHGTHVAGTIGAVRDSKGVAGVAPRASLYGVKVLDKGGSGQYSNIISGIEWAVENKMDVINMSLGGGGPVEAMKNVMIAADKAGVTIVCAAGNDSGPVNYPAKYPQSIAVSASDSSDKLASFSSKGAEIAFVAPGVAVKSAYIGGGYKTMSGTSMACPHVAGLAALAIASGAHSPAAVRSALKSAASTMGLKPTEEGAGMINAEKLADSLGHWNK